MNTNDNQQLDLEAAQRIQERVQFYFVTLTFTLLALSVQTAEFTGSNISSASELIGWVSLLISGIAGLSRLNSTPANFIISMHQHSVQSNIDSTIELIENGDQSINLQKTGETVNAINYLEQQNRKKDEFLNQEHALLKKQSLLMRAHKSALMLGLILLLISRGIDHAFALLK